MINELYELSCAMQRANVSGRAQHRSYLPLPNVTAKAPCIEILLSDGEVVGLRSLSGETASLLRKYGNNQGSYPAMNLAPLYRVTDEDTVHQLSDILAGKTTQVDLKQVKSWCHSNNWCPKFLEKYKNCLCKKPMELQKKLCAFPEDPIHKLFRQTEPFQDPNKLRQGMERQAMCMLEQKRDMVTALQVLFYSGKGEKEGSEDFGTLSVIFDSQELVEEGYPTTGSFFTEQLNDALIRADAEDRNTGISNSVDAFGRSFSPLEEPMPTVKLAGGFTASLRTMFKGQPCQTRYGRIENATYPISPQLRTQLQSALGWISEEGKRDKTWTSLNKNEILFAYPERAPDLSEGLAAALNGNGRSGQSGFEEASRSFLKCLKKTKEPGTDPHADFIRIFVLRKLDNARTKVVYSYNTTPHEMERRSEDWTLGCRNLPPLRLGSCPTPFPIDTSAILNRSWKRNGTLTTDKCKPFCSYHGLELFFDDGELARQDLSVLVRNLEPAAMALGAYSANIPMDAVRKEIHKFRQSFLLLGLLLYRLGSGKEQYMQAYPYLYGQLLKVSDELHILYCRIVRKQGQIPTQLVGGSMYNSAAELPRQTLAQLGQRMSPYIVWAKAYQYQNVKVPDQESWRARWYLHLYETMAAQLAACPEPMTRFTDGERAQLFLGYLANFPKKEDSEKNNGGNEDEN